MTDDAVMFLIHARQKAGNILECNERDVEAVAKSNKSGRFYRRVDVQDARKESGLIRHDTDRLSTEPCESDDDVGRKMFLDLEKITFIDNRMNNVADVVGLIR